MLQEGKICDRINESIGGNSTCPPPWGGVRGGDKYSIAEGDTFNQEEQQTKDFAVLIPCGDLNRLFSLSDEVTKGNLTRRMRVMALS